MWHSHAVQRRLAEDVAGIELAEPVAGEEAPTPLEVSEEILERLRQARLKALRVLILCWLGLALLLLFHSGERSFLYLGPAEDAVFTVGVLVVAVFSGFRLGQLRKLWAVENLCREIHERSAG